MATHIDSYIDELHLSYMPEQRHSIIGGIQSFLLVYEEFVLEVLKRMRNLKLRVLQYKLWILLMRFLMILYHKQENYTRSRRNSKFKEKRKKASKLMFTLIIDQWDIELLEAQQARRQEKGFALFGNNLCLLTLAEVEMLKPLQHYASPPQLHSNPFPLQFLLLIKQTLLLVQYSFSMSYKI